MKWEIRSKTGELRAEVEKLEFNDQWMEQKYVTTSIESPVPINFKIGDYLIYRGERFEINYDPGKIKSAPLFVAGNAFRYENVKFNSLADELTRCDFLDVVLNDNQLHFTGLPKFTFYGGVKQVADRIQANLDRAYGRDYWKVVLDEDFEDTTELNISIDTQKVSDVLGEVVVNQFKAYFTIHTRTITIGAAGVPADYLFTYGEGNGLYEVEENAEADQQIVTRVRAYGSTRNIPHRYYNDLSGADGKKLIPDNMAVQYLMLPDFPYKTQDPYLDSPNISALGVREGTIFFDGSGDLEEIYPSIEGMTADKLKAAGLPCNSTGELDVLVSAEQMTDNGVGEIEGDAMEGSVTTTAKPATFKVTIKDIGFDINDHLTTEPATISFKTGMLGGRDFEIVKCTPIKSGGVASGYQLELNRVFDDSISLWFPYKNYNAKAGDKFVLLYIKMPEVYIKYASQLLKERAQEWLEKNDYSRKVYAPKIDELFMARQHDLAMASEGKIKSLHDTLCAGMQLLFEDKDLHIDAAIFIDSLTIKEGDNPIPTYEVVLKEEKTVGRLQKMQNQIDSLASGQGQGGGGYTAQQIRSLIDAYGGTRFLSKVKDDRTPYKLSSDTAFEVGEYLSGATGAIIGRNKDGRYFAEVDELIVRVKAIFEELTIAKASTLSGEQYITPGSGVKIARVRAKDAQGNILSDINSPLATEYVCYFLLTQDGDKSGTFFVINDQAICKSFEAKEGTTEKTETHFYWRKVISVNNGNTEKEQENILVDAVGNEYGYVILSATDCAEGSDVPQVGDEICQFGYRKDDKPERQTAMVLSTTSADAPSIKLYSGINNYSLEGKAVVSFGRDPLTGAIYFRLGSSKDKYYLEYTQNKGLEVAGTISTKSTFGDQSLSEYIEDEVKRAGIRYTLTLSNEMAAIACDASGNPTGGLPTCKVTIYEGTQEASGWDIKITPSGCTAKYSNGTITIQSVSKDTASVVVTATKGGETLTATMNLYKVRPGADGTSPNTYDIWTSADFLIKSFTGEISPSSIQIVKKTYTPDGGETSAPNNLYAQRIGVDSVPVLLRADGDANAVALSITSRTEKVELTLKNTAGTILDVKRIPVLSDASDIQIGTRNLLRYSKEVRVGNQNDTAWGNNFMLFTQGLKAQTYYAFRVGSIRLYNMQSPLTGKFMMRIYDRDVNNVLLTFHIDVTDRVVVFKTTNAIPKDAKLYLYSGDADSGTIFEKVCYYSEVSLIEGNVPLQDWKEAPEDLEEAIGKFDYLEEAFKESITLAGGVVLASVVALGKNNESFTSQTTWSGISGLYNEKAVGGGIAQWTGGDMYDLAEYYTWSNTEGQWKAKPNIRIPDRIARGVDRMDGSGYRASGNLFWDANGHTTFVGDIIARGTFRGMRKRYVTQINSENISQYSYQTDAGAEYIKIDATGPLVQFNYAPKNRIYIPNEWEYVGETLLILNQSNDDVTLASTFRAIGASETARTESSITLEHGQIVQATLKMVNITGKLNKIVPNLVWIYEIFNMGEDSEVKLPDPANPGPLSPYI